MAELAWNVDHGYYPATPEGVYDEAYFQKYVGYAQTDLGQAILIKRLEFVKAVVPDYVTVVDVGIGCGQFVIGRQMASGQKNTLGYDVNPAGVKWLEEQKAFHDITREAPAMSFWDSLEHIQNPKAVLERCTSVVFVSLPIFRDREHVMRSKHFRPTEHYWYWTEAGFIRFMSECGFRVIRRSAFESDLGREDILSFAFRRGAA
jgi:hypothetical protein